MFRLASLECSGCRYHGSSDPYYDDENKRPCFSLCGHSICTQCVDQFTTCPICDKTIELIENYAARNLLEDYRRDPMKVFKNWWNAKGDEQETCTKCFESSENLRFCITCYSSKLDFIVVYGDVNKEKNEKKMKRRKQIEEFHKKSLYSEIDSDEDPEEIELKIHFNCDFYLFANFACCPSCVIDHHHEHLVNTKEELEATLEVFKQSAAMIATKFLADKVNKMASACKIKTMRLHRTMEKLSHFATNYFRSPECVFRVPDIHHSRRSVLNKFFAPLPWENLNKITRDNMNEIIECLDYQMNHLECAETCNCTSLWNEMHQLSFGNQVEKQFVQSIESLDNRVVSKCPFPNHEFQMVKNKTIQALPTNYTPALNVELMDLISFYKNKCFELLEGWWNCEPSQLTFCLNCSSYSENLETGCIGRTKILSMKSPGNEGGGFNHLRSPHSFCKLSNEDGCQFNVVGLKDIDGYEFAIKAASMELVLEVIKTQIEEKVTCESQKLRFTKYLGVLKTKLKQYFLHSINGRKSETTSLEISTSISNFKAEWEKYLDQTTKKN